jgi:hypothetical protein
MEHFCQPQGFYISHGTLISAMKHLGQPQDTWISCLVRGSAMEHSSKPKGIWISHEKLVSALKGPKREMFDAEIFTEIRPVWVDDLESRPKNLKSLFLGPYITLNFLGFLL